MARMGSDIHFCQRCATTGIRTRVRAYQVNCPQCQLELAAQSSSTKHPAPPAIPQSVVTSNIPPMALPSITILHTGHVVIRQALGDGTRILMANLTPLLLGSLIFYAAQYLFGTIYGLIMGNIKYHAVQLCFIFVDFGWMFIDLIFFQSLCIMCLRTVRGEVIRIQDIMIGFSQVWSVLKVGIAICLGLALSWGAGALFISLTIKESPGFGDPSYIFIALFFMLGAYSFYLIIVAPFLFVVMPALGASGNALGALKMSLQCGIANWGAIFGLNILISIIFFLASSITFGIGFIFLLPWLAAVMTATYLQVVGDENNYPLY